MGVRITWNDDNAGVDEFRIYRDVSPMDVEMLPAPLASVPSNKLLYDDGTVEDNTTYYYRVGVVKGTAVAVSNEIFVDVGIVGNRGTVISLAHANSPFITSYQWDDTTGYGTKYTNPAVLPTGDGRGVTYNPSGSVISVSHTNSPFITSYQWDDTTGYGTKYTDPAVLPTGNGLYGITFN